MRTVILAGGLGTRLAEETQVKPKPMVEIGERPILWHILKHYEHFGIREVIIALGYKGDVIKRHFVDSIDLNGSLSIHGREQRIERHGCHLEDWTIHLVETGLETLTGGRLKRLQGMLQDETFMMTYGDGVSDVDLGRLLEFHRSHRRLATLTAVRPPARFGALEFGGDQVTRFAEKSQLDEGWINGGFFVLEPGVFEYIEGDATEWERGALVKLAHDGQLCAYRHHSFWQCMDTLRDKKLLEELWESGEAPWKVWK